METRASVACLTKPHVSIQTACPALCTIEGCVVRHENAWILTASSFRFFSLCMPRSEFLVWPSICTCALVAPMKEAPRREALGVRKLCAIVASDNTR